MSDAFALKPRLSVKSKTKRYIIFIFKTAKCEIHVKCNYFVIYLLINQYQYFLVTANAIKCFLNDNLL